MEFVAALFLAGLGAYLNRYHVIEVAFGLELLPGHVLGALAAFVLPWPWGAAGPLLVMLPSLALWAHPWALPSAALEGVAISYCYWRLGRDKTLFIDSLYWLFVGLPLVFGLYSAALGMAPDGALAAASKQGANAVLASSLGFVLRHISPPWLAKTRYASPRPNARAPRTREVLVLFLSLSLMAPTMMWTFMYAGYRKREAIISAEEEVAFLLEYFAAGYLRTNGTYAPPELPKGFVMFGTGPDGRPLHWSLPDPQAGWPALHRAGTASIVGDPAQANPMKRWRDSWVRAEFQFDDGTVFIAQRSFTAAAASANAILSRMFVFLLFWLVAANSAAFSLAKLWVRPLEALKKKALEITSDERLTERPLSDELWPRGGSYEILDLRDSLVAMTGTILHRSMELDMAKAEAQRQTKNVERYLAFMGHELKSPLAAIRASIDAAVEEPAEAPKLLGLAVREADALLSLVDDILDQSRAGSGRLELKPAPWRPLQQIPAWLEPFRILASRRGLRFELILEESLSGEYLADPARLRQILATLVSNAIKYSERGAIRINGALEAVDGVSSLVCSVSDQGRGIEPERIDEIWVPFAGAGGRAGGQSSHGLGLSIVKSIVQTMGGSIRVSSKLGEGTVFTVIVPLIPVGVAGRDLGAGNRDGSQGGGASSTTAAAIRSWAGARVLIADDQHIIRLTLRKQLERLGAARVDEAPDGYEALRLYEAGPYDVVISDERMDGPGGNELAQAIRAIEARLERERSFIIVASADQVEDHDSFDVFMPKPLTLEKLEKVFR
jgi:signal transduction histidine kinase